MAHVHSIADQLLLIERELRALGLWQSESPDEIALSSSAPFCVDTLIFSEWLQWIFLPKMKQLIEAGADLPQGSAISAMGEVVYRESLDEKRALIHALKCMDRLLGEL